MEEGHPLRSYTAGVHYWHYCCGASEGAGKDFRVWNMFRIGHKLDSVVPPVDSSLAELLGSASEHLHHEAQVEHIRCRGKQAKLHF